MTDRTEEPRRRRAPTKVARPRRGSASDAARSAVAQIRDLTEHDVEGVVSVERSDDGWRVGVEVVESHRIPESCDILAIYEVGLEAGGDLASYRRTERYARGQTLGRSR